MTRLSIVLAGLALALAPSAGAAQAAPAELRGPFVGFGIGLGNVRDQSLDAQRLGPMLHARVGWGFGRSTAVMVEGAWHGLGDEQARVDDVVLQQVVRRPKILQTMSLLAALQVGLPGEMYVRPGVGLAWHNFPVYRLDTDAPMAEVREEAGPAGQIAIGRTLGRSRRFPVAVEAIGLWSEGEDSTGSRWAAGIQVVPMLRF